MTQPNHDNDKPPSPTDQVRQLYEHAETQTARAMEQLVNRDSFGEMIAKVTENVVAVTRISNDALDLVVRNLRLADRSDLTRLGRQLARNEDKLESVLQEVERLGEQMRTAERDRSAYSEGSADRERSTRDSEAGTGSDPAPARALEARAGAGAELSRSDSDSAPRTSS